MKTASYDMALDYNPDIDPEGVWIDFRYKLFFIPHLLRVSVIVITLQFCKATIC
jgi:hypothetical protein